VNAAELEAGDRLRQFSRQSAVVVGTSRESHPEGVAVFNLRVPGVHNYFAGEGVEEAFLVHNADYDAKKLREAAEAGAKKIARKLEETTGALQKAGETAATAKGRKAHRDYDPGPGYKKEVKLPSGKRADAVNFDEETVRELKPDNDRAKKRGAKQVEEYREELEREYGGDWTSVVDTYQ
jgi:hypothetical protein